VASENVGPRRPTFFYVFAFFKNPKSMTFHFVSVVAHVISNTKKQFTISLEKQNFKSAWIKWPTQGRATYVYSQNVTQH